MTALGVFVAANRYDLTLEIGDDGYIWIRSTGLSLSMRLRPDEAATLRDQLTATLNQQEKT